MTSLRKVIRKCGVTVLCCASILVCVIAEAVAQQGFVIVVNVGNADADLTVDQLSRMFQKKTTRWPSGGSVVPVDLPEHSPVREAFTQAIHGRTVTAIKAYWQSQIFSGRRVPPVEEATDADVLAFVGAEPNAIGYVSASVTLPGNVRRAGVRDGSGTTVADRHAVFGSDEVDEPPERLSGPTLRYPARLRRSRTEGSVVVDFVVGVDGRVEDNSITVIESPHRDFERAAEELIRSSVYRPGRTGGTTVRVRVQQRVSFRLTGT
jgi:TonB family protein